MTGQELITEKDPIKRGFGWKRFDGTLEGDEEEKYILKNIIHDLPNLKNYCCYFETNRRSVIMMAGLDKDDHTFLNADKLRDLMTLPISEEDKRKLYTYFDASTKIMVLETGMAELPGGRYREIAFDKYYGRMTYIQIMEKYGVSRETVHRALKRTNRYLVRYAGWYLDLLGTVKM